MVNISVEHMAMSVPSSLNAAHCTALPKFAWIFLPKPSPPNVTTVRHNAPSSHQIYFKRSTSFSRCLLQRHNTLPWLQPAITRRKADYSLGILKEVHFCRFHLCEICVGRSDTGKGFSQIIRSSSQHHSSNVSQSLSEGTASTIPVMFHSHYRKVQRVKPVHPPTNQFYFW